MSVVSVWWKYYITCNCTSLPNSLICDTMLEAWNQPYWEYLNHRNWQCYKSGLLPPFSFGESIVRQLLAHQWWATIFPLDGRTFQSESPRLLPLSAFLFRRWMNKADRQIGSEGRPFLLKTACPCGCYSLSAFFPLLLINSNEGLPFFRSWIITQMVVTPITYTLG